MIRGKSKPQRTTRLLLVVICLISFTSLFSQNYTPGLWLALMSLLQAVVLCLLSLKWGIGGRSNLDGICVLLCVVGIIWWLLSGQSLGGLVASIVADLVAVVPSAVKTFRWPKTESWLFYLLDAISGLIFALIGPRTFIALVYPLYIVLVNLAFVALILVGARLFPVLSTP